MRLRTRFVAALLAVAVVLSVVSLVGFALYRDAVVTGERADIERTSDAVAAQIDVVLTEKQRTVRLWSENPALTDHGSDAQSEALGSFVATTRFSGASVIAANGTMTALRSEGLTAAQQQSVEGAGYGNRTYHRRALTGETYVSEPVEAETGNLIVTVSAPIREGGAVVGTLNAAFHVREGDLFGSLRSRNASEERVQIAAGDRVLYADGPAVTEGGVGPANATVETTGWTVSVSRTEEAVSERLWLITLMQVGASALVLASLAAFGAWLYREFVDNFESLHRGFAALVEGDYGATVELSGATEWREVRDHFNELSETLARRRVEVTVLNRVLRHNLRNAMTVVLGNLDRIEAEANEAAVAEGVAAIRRRSESLLELANHARAIESSLRTDRREAPPRSIDSVLSEVAATVRDEYPHADVTVADVPEDAWICGGDLLAIALDELARNAISHAERRPPSVCFETTADDRTVSVSVSDEGPGLPPVERRLLTEPFEETATEHGSGLGLWLVKWLVQWIDGEIDVTVDDGTTVTVTVPRAEPPVSPSEE